MPLGELAGHMSRRKKNTNVFSLSFLDCICCGFGAIILIFIVSMGVQQSEILNLRRILENIVQQRLLQLNDYQIRKDELDVLLDLEKEKRKRIDRERAKMDALIAKLKQQISDKENSRQAAIVCARHLSRPRRSCRWRRTCPTRACPRP